MHPRHVWYLGWCGCPQVLVHVLSKLQYVWYHRETRYWTDMAQKLCTATHLSKTKGKSWHQAGFDQLMLSRVGYLFPNPISTGLNLNFNERHLIFRFRMSGDRGWICELSWQINFPRVSAFRSSIFTTGLLEIECEWISRNNTWHKKMCDMFNL